MMHRRKIKVVNRRLRGAYGLAYKGMGLIEVDPRQKPRSMLNTLIHESLHLMFPEYGEGSVRSKACSITRVLWERGFRLIAK